MTHALLKAVFSATLVWLCVPQDANKPQTSAASKDRTAAASSYQRELDYLDANGDKKIDAAEFARGQQMAAMILALSWDTSDRDGDGAVRPSEFNPAAAEATQSLLETDAENEEDAENDLASAVPAKVLLDRLAANEAYADEIAQLREAIEDLDDDEAVVSYVVGHPDLYPHLLPAIRTWARYYPVRPELHKYVKPHPWRAYHGLHGPRHPKPPGAGPKPTTPKPRGAKPRPAGPRRP